MVRPAAFAYNEQTAGSNSFQRIGKFSHQAVHELALKEFDEAVKDLLQHDIDVTVIEDTVVPHKPDAIFPNNWLSIHENTIVLYPMATPNRRLERRDDIIDKINHQLVSKHLIDLTSNEKNNCYLEGTGSLVLDRVHRIAYANISERTDATLVDEWCQIFGYKSFQFHATIDKISVYHTNVIMSIGNTIAVCCTEVVNEKEREKLIDLLKKHHNLVEITTAQMKDYAGNLLLMRNKSDQLFWIMSQTAFDTFSKEQKQLLENDGALLPLKLDTIEHFGGGSARCMLAEIAW